MNSCGTEQMEGGNLLSASQAAAFFHFLRAAMIFSPLSLSLPLILVLAGKDCQLKSRAIPTRPNQLRTKKHTVSVCVLLTERVRSLLQILHLTAVLHTWPPDTPLDQTAALISALTVHCLRVVSKWRICHPLPRGPFVVAKLLSKSDFGD